MRSGYLVRVIVINLALAGTITSAAAKCGVASFYSRGKITADGEKFKPGAVTAAHRKLPFNTKVAVLNRQTGKNIVVRINDRGPFVRGRLLDLSAGAARSLGDKGLAPVCLRVLSYGGKIARLRRAAYHGLEGLKERLAEAKAKNFLRIETR